MITSYILEDYCSEEIRSLLEKNGYMGSTNTHLDKDGYRVKEITLQSAMKWLREVHNIDISVTPDRKAGYSVLIFKDKRLPFYTLDSYSIYEEACEAAIRYCLENLI